MSSFDVELIDVEMVDNTVKARETADILKNAMYGKFNFGKIQMAKVFIRNRL
jgi:hypothetical protein